MRNWIDYLIEEKPHHDGAWGGKHRIYKFENGYGASVIPEYIERNIDENDEHEDPEANFLGYMKPKKGFWEVAVFYNDELCYDTHITDDVLRHLNDPELDDVLGKISRL
jgi:hypothetical protein|tara:strand:- start:704 stop:1030 length:327 start_codon:yes stop_codon:yes gene_type:complete